MRAAALACLVLLVALVGCVPAANDDLKALVEEASLPGMDPYSCESGLSSFDTDPKSWYGCWDYVRGDLGAVANGVGSRLNVRGFEVSANVGDLTVELTARRGTEIVCIDVLAPGFARGRNTWPEEVNPPAGEVFVDVWAVERRNAAADPCAAMPA